MDSRNPGPSALCTATAASRMRPDSSSNTCPIGLSFRVFALSCFRDSLWLPEHNDQTTMVAPGPQPASDPSSRKGVLFMFWRPGPRLPLLVAICFVLASAAFAHDALQSRTVPDGLGVNIH